MTTKAIEAKPAKDKASEIGPINGWLLLSREEIEPCKFGDWYIAWLEIFPSRKDALRFAQENKWYKPYRAVRGQIGMRP